MTPDTGEEHQPRNDEEHDSGRVFLCAVAKNQESDADDCGHTATTKPIDEADLEKVGWSVICMNVVKIDGFGFSDTRCRAIICHLSVPRLNGKM